jgi:hypothetical protein
MKKTALPCNTVLQHLALITSNSLWKNWWDGLLLVISLSVAGAAVSVPAQILRIMLRQMGLRAFEDCIAATFLLTVGPVLFSRVFRALDYTKSADE